MPSRKRNGSGAAGTKSNAAQSGAGAATTTAGAGASQQTAGAETVADIGQAEAYILNMKRLVENAMNRDEALGNIVVTKAQREAAASGDFDGQVRKLALDLLATSATATANCVNLSNRINNEHVASDGRVRENAESHARHMNSINLSERERTLRNGDMLDVIREAGVSADTTVYQDVIELAATKVANAVIASGGGSSAASGSKAKS